MSEVNNLALSDAISLSVAICALNEAKNGSQAYSFDLDRIGYILTIEQDGKTTISNHQNSTNAINNVELGTKFVPKW